MIALKPICTECLDELKKQQIIDARVYNQKAQEKHNKKAGLEQTL